MSRKKEAFMRLETVANYTGLSIGYVNHLIDTGELKKIELNGTDRVRKSEVDNWLDKEVEPEKLINMSKELQNQPDIDELSEMFEMDKEEISKILNDSEN